MRLKMLYRNVEWNFQTLFLQAISTNNKIPPRQHATYNKSRIIQKRKLN